MIPDESFGHGYVMSIHDRATAATANWAKLSVGEFTYRFHSRTSYFHHRAKPDEDRSARPLPQVVLVGQPVDLDAGTHDGREIAARVASLMRRDGVEGATRYVAYLGGRFTCFIHNGSTLEIIPDCHATQSIYWRDSSDGFTASSHVELVGGGGLAELDEHALWMYERLVELRRGAGTKYFPGIVTTYQDVRPVMPNCSLHVDTVAGQVEHRRFYPFSDLVRRDVNEAYETFEELFRTHVRLLSRLGTVGISLTSGLDSRVTLAGSCSFLPPGSFTFTFYRAADVSGAHADDMYEANRLAWEFGLPHRVLRWGGRNRDEPFDRIFSATWPRLGQARTIAQAFYSQLPRDIVHFQSTIAETGTAFYKRRDATDISAKRLTYLWHGPAVVDEPGFVAAFDDFIEFSDFRPEKLYNLDYHDAFYWEHRNARWAANRYHEADLAHRVVHPFNQRGLIEAMLSIPVDNRSEKILLHRLVDRFPPPGR